jgi:hypothetical protein
MGAERRGSPADQEFSIKRRGRELYHDDDAPADAGPVKSFEDYLKETPADPLPTWAQAVLWTLGVIVALLLLAALWNTQRASRPRVRTTKTVSVDARAGTVNDASEDLQTLMAAMRVPVRPKGR